MTSVELHLRIQLLLAAQLLLLSIATTQAEQSVEVPQNLRVVLENTQPLTSDRGGRLPLLVLPISHALAGIDDARAEQLLRDLDERGIGYTVDWDPHRFDSSVTEGLRIAALQTKLGLEVCVNANACLYSFFDGSPDTLHVDAARGTFAESSFGPELGCPFALAHRVGAIKERVEQFLRAYRDAGLKIDLVFADWEIDGPIEWNGAWDTCKRCERCRRQITNIDDFRAFQTRLREVRSELQRVTFGENVRAYFPETLVGNYGVYPHDGYRYWYDYFERETPGAPVRRDQRASYREWAHEFDGAGYTFAMPVVYTWYPTFQWYDFDDLDYRWFYNMLLVGSNAGQHTPPATPIVPFVHWTTTAPPEQPDPAVRQFSREKYQELLWHLLLRGHDTFFLWCVADELANEIRLVHEVYAESLAYRGFLDRGTPVSFDVPQEPGTVVSGLRINNRVLIRRTPFGERPGEPVTLRLADGGEIVVPPQPGLHVLPVQTREPLPGLLSIDGQLRFPIGIYEMPAEDAALKDMAAAGINLVHCSDKADLDRAQAAGMKGWMPLGVQQGATDALRRQIEAVVDHPALAVWEGPDEIVWTFTAYSFLAKAAGFTRDDWNAQTDKAVAYSEAKGAEIIPKMRAGIALVRELDSHHRPFWMNEAADSDVQFVRQYVDAVDIIGCDYYAVRSTGTDLQSVGRLVDRWDAIGRGRPVWMVLQGFSWHTAHPERTRLYPTFAQSRFMAYDSLVHGAKGILYWGSNQIDDPAYRASLYALTSELSSLQPFLAGEDHLGVRADVIDDLFDPPGRGVRAKLLRHGTDYLLMLVNEDAQRHLGVDVSGLGMIEGRALSLLYGSETARVQQGGIVTRLQGHEVKLFATNTRYASSRTDGRGFPHASRE
ncbi:MAG: hypothetical protein AB7U20_12455 [Planctomycetaceae bacterium]